MKNFKNGQKIRVGGEVKYGERYVRTACCGILLEKKHGKYALCRLSNVDGDENVVVMVNKRFIYECSVKKVKHHFSDGQGSLDLD